MLKKTPLSTLVCMRESLSKEIQSDSFTFSYQRGMLSLHVKFIYDSILRLIKLRAKHGFLHLPSKFHFPLLIRRSIFVITSNAYLIPHYTYTNNNKRKTTFYLILSQVVAVKESYFSQYLLPISLEVSIIGLFAERERVTRKRVDCRSRNATRNLKLAWK